MILTRVGNKRRISPQIVPHFPDHHLYIEPFFGAGGMFFHKPKSRYNILNDLDRDVFNLFSVVIERPRDLATAWKYMPVHQALWDKWKAEPPEDPVQRAVRFLLLSNCGFMGKPNTLRFNNRNAKRLVLERLAATREMLWDCEFSCHDFRDLIRRIPFGHMRERDRAFIYSDPPYLECTHSYQAGFTRDDVVDHFDVLCASGIKFAMSEFDHPFVVEQAAMRGLEIRQIGERRNLGNRRMEILITNY